MPQEERNAPLAVMAKPVGSRCNMRCTYCYYLEKGKDSASRKQTRMSYDLLEKLIRQTIAASPGPTVSFTWHGGEPMLKPLSFYKQAVRLQQYYGRGKRISNSIQTNGLFLTPEWCQFLHDEGWLVGISIDGTQEQHDAYRLDAQGEGTWQRVMDGIKLLNEYGVEWNAMATANINLKKELTLTLTAVQICENP